MHFDKIGRKANLVDGIGSTVFAWPLGSQLACEAGPWASDTVSFGYTSRQRRSLTEQQLDASAWTQSYGYDAYWRLTNVTSLVVMPRASYCRCGVLLVLELRRFDSWIQSDTVTKRLQKPVAQQ